MMHCTITATWLLALYGLRCFGKAAEEPSIFWTSTLLSESTTSVMTSPALLRHQIKVSGSVVTKKVSSLKQPHYLSPITCNGHHHEVTAVDIGRGNLVTFNTVDRSYARSHGGVNEKVSDIAVDWSTGNIYWTDSSHRWIAVADRNFSLFKIVVPNIYTPKAILVYPQKGYLFWTQGVSGDQYDSPEVKRATLSGDAIETWATTFGAISSITLDIYSQRIFWIDTSDNKVYAVDLNFTQGKPYPKMFYSDAHTTFHSLANVKSLVYITDPLRGRILMVNQTNGWVEGFISTAEPEGVTSCGGDTQPTFQGSCNVDNGGCEQFCFPGSLGTDRKCGCSIGSFLDKDEVSCKTELLEGDFILVADSELHSIFQISLDGNKISKMPAKHAKSPVQVEYDISTNTVFWSDIGLGQVVSSHGDGSNHRVLSSDQLVQPTGLAIDHISRNVYWTDEGAKTINVVRYDGGHKKVLISNGVNSPRGVAIHSFLGFLWWTDWGKQTIEQATMGGKGRMVLIKTGIVWPNGLTIDFEDEKLVWCDAYEDRIEMSNFDGSGRVLLAQFDNTHIFGITTSRDFIYWTDWNEHSVMRMSKKNHRDVQRFGPRVFDKLSDVNVVTDLPEKYKKAADSHPCARGNGGCVGLCIPQKLSFGMKGGLGRICVCGDGETGACNQPTYTDTTPPTFNGSCPTDMVFVATKCQDRVLVDYRKPVAYDNSGSVTMKGPLNPTPLELRPGRYIKSYTAVDEAGNQASCIFLVTVKVIKCPNPETRFPDAVELGNYTCGFLQGSEINVICPNGTRVNGTAQMACGVNGRWSSTPHCTNDTRELDENFQVEQTTKEIDIQRSLQTMTPTAPSSDNLHVTKSPALHPWLSILLPGVVGVAMITTVALTHVCLRNTSTSSVESVEKQLSFYNLRRKEKKRRTRRRKKNEQHLESRCCDDTPLSINVIEPSEQTVYAEVHRAETVKSHSGNGEFLECGNAGIRCVSASNADNLSVTVNTLTGKRTSSLPGPRRVAPACGKLCLPGSPWERDSHLCYGTIN